ncbi:MAG TPA: TIGR03790 family protein [Verrucomicrobiales bacterium]|nr:TIGR03790 family protein [Verrucomicrobiales bacterium]
MYRPILLLFFALLPSVLRSQDSISFDYRPATVVVYNASDPASTELANYYVKQRGIPAGNLVGLKCQNIETISREVFDKEIDLPLRTAFDERGWWETTRQPKDGLMATKTTMRVITLIQGIPLRIATQAQPPTKDPRTGKDLPPNPIDENASSVDSELAVFGVLEKLSRGMVSNPYFKATTPFFKTGLTPMFMVGRIDGPNKAIAKRLIDDAIAVEKEGLYGKAYIDLAQKNQPGYKMGEDWLINSARMLELRGIPVIMDTWAPTLPSGFPMSDCALYLGWYTQNADGPFVNPAFRLRRGAVAVHIHSFSASTLKSDSLNWCGPLVAHGACATLGNVFEPYLSFCAHLDIFTDRLLAGYNLSEAAWMSTPALSWMSVVIGDPLYRPFGAVPGNGDKKAAPEYKAIRLALQRWGKPEQKSELEDGLQRMAEGLKSPAIYEFLALHAQAGENKNWPAAQKWFDLAAKSTTTTEGLIRLQFLMADAMRRDGDNRKAIKLLNGVVEKYPSAPEAGAARTLVQQIRDSK